jgi:pimeloyl-ACP methyl ester carboxylesterase
MILLGHSLGGFIATSYAIHHADRIKHLILADPWGFSVRPTAPEVIMKLPMWAKVVRKVIEPFNPFAMLRMAGPWGPSLVIKFRSDLLKKYEHLFDDARIGEYLYHCNAQAPSGETAFKSMTYQFGWAKNPMVDRVRDIPASLSMTLIYGSRSWVDYGVGYEVKYRRADSYVDVEVIREAGHHVYADKSELFNSLVNRTCDMIDRRVGVLKQRSPQAVKKATPVHRQSCKNMDSAQGALKRVCNGESVVQTSVDEEVQQEDANVK